VETLSTFPVILPTRWRAARTAKAAVIVALEVFPQHIISLDSDIKSPSCSPGLSPRAYFLCGYCKVCVTSPRANGEIKKRQREKYLGDSAKKDASSTGKPSGKIVTGFG